MVHDDSLWKKCQSEPQPKIFQKKSLVFNLKFKPQGRYGFHGFKLNPDYSLKKPKSSAGRAQANISQLLIPSYPISLETPSPGRRNEEIGHHWSMVDVSLMFRWCFVVSGALSSVSGCFLGAVRSRGPMSSLSTCWKSFQIASRYLAIWQKNVLPRLIPIWLVRPQRKGWRRHEIEIPGKISQNAVSNVSNQRSAAKAALCALGLPPFWSTRWWQPRGVSDWDHNYIKHRFGLGWIYLWPITQSSPNHNMHVLYYIILYYILYYIILIYIILYCIILHYITLHYIILYYIILYYIIYSIYIFILYHIYRERDITYSISFCEIYEWDTVLCLHPPVLSNCSDWPSVCWKV